MKTIFQFLIIGALAYLIQQWIGSQEIISVTPNKITILKSQWQTSTGLQADHDKLKALVAVYVEEEILFREAHKAKVHYSPRFKQRILKVAEFLELDPAESNAEALFDKAIDAGLHKNDAVIRTMLISSMRDIILKKIPSITLSNEAIQEYYVDNVERYAVDGSLSFEHVFVSNNRHSDSKYKAEQLRQHQAFTAVSTANDDFASLGDPFIKGRSFSRVTMDDLTELMGGKFSRGVARLDINEWSKPIASVYGWHIVRVTIVNPFRVLSLPEAKRQIKRDLYKINEGQAFYLALAEIKRGYTIVIDWSLQESNTTIAAKLKSNAQGSIIGLLAKNNGGKGG